MLRQEEKEFKPEATKKLKTVDTSRIIAIMPIGL